MRAIHKLGKLVLMAEVGMKFELSIYSSRMSLLIVCVIMVGLLMNIDAVNRQ